MRRVITIATVTALLGMAPAAVALPALPPGVNVQDVVGAPISVPAGQTTTVDLGVPVSADYNSGGWLVVSAGTAVSVTAPAEGGGSIVVPVSAAGYSVDLTLVAEEDASVPALPAPTDTSGGGQASAGDPEESPASPVEHSDAELIDLESTVDGNRIVASMGMVQALKLLNQFKDVSRDGLSLRYLDSGGRVITGVTRDIDEASRTLTLTYPAGETPDNPFIMEVLRDDAAVAVVTLTDPDHATAGGTAESPSAQSAGLTRLAGAGVLALLVIVGVAVVLTRRRHARK